MQILTEAEEFMKKYETLTIILTLPDNFKNATLAVKSSYFLQIIGFHYINCLCHNFITLYYSYYFKQRIDGLLCM